MNGGRCLRFYRHSLRQRVPQAWFRPAGIPPSRHPSLRASASDCTDTQHKEDTAPAPIDQQKRKQRLSDAEIAERIRRSHRRRKQFEAELLDCPGCRQNNFHPPSLYNHMQTCCPDLLDNKQEWSAALLRRPPDRAAVDPLLQRARAAERRLRLAALDLAFRQVDAAGASIRREPPDFAPTLNLPVDRCRRLLALAIKDTPMPGDPEPVDVLYEDEWLIAVNKPPFLGSQPIHRHVGNSMVNRLITYLGEPPYVLHRLDMNTSGVILFAKRPAVATRIHKQFRNRTVSKQYVAAALGRPAEAAFRVDAPIATHPVIAAGARVHSSGKPSQTDVRVLAVSDAALAWRDKGEAWCQPPEQQMSGACLVACKPHTGRTHQIRLHLAEAGHPILGDTLYGVLGPWIERQALHAWRLEFWHPELGKTVAVEAPLPADMLALADACELRLPEVIPVL